VGLQPGPLLLGRLAVPGVAGLGWVRGQITAKGVHPHQPIVAGIESAPPAGAVRTVDVPVGQRGAIADGAKRGDAQPRLRPGILVPAERALSAGGQVLLDQGNGRAGELRGAAAIADAVTADVVEHAIDIDHIPGPVRADLGCGH
jgi:hypothetical protein